MIGSNIKLNDKVPESWILKPIGEVCEFEKGKKPKNTGNQSKTRSVPYINIKAFESGMPEEFAEPGSYPMFSKDNVLIVWDGARAGLVGKGVSGYIGSTLSKVWSQSIQNKYLFYFLRLNYNYINTNTKGVGIPHVDPNILNAIAFPIAPSNEQKRIVAEIEKQFSRLDEAVAALKRIKANLKRHKASVLKSAIEGKLTEATNDEQYFNKDVWQSIDFVIESLDQGWSPRCERQPSEKPEEWGVIKTTAVQPFHYLETENKKLPKKFVPRPHIEIKQSDILVTRAGPRKRVGITCLVRHTRPRLMFCDKVYRLKCKSDVIRHAYLELVLNAPQIVDDLNELKTGISDSGVNLTQKGFGNLKIPLPPIKVQEQIEVEVERLLSISEDVEKDLDLNIMRSERLRQSILKKAFSGKLVPQDANDAPAASLLR